MIIPSTLGQTTTSLVVGYNLVSADNKVEKKELRLIFANPMSGFTSGVSLAANLNKAEEVFEWIRLVKSVWFVYHVSEKCVICLRKRSKGTLNMLILIVF